MELHALSLPAFTELHCQQSREENPISRSNTPGKPRFTTRSIVRGGLIAAIYVVLTLIFQPISFSMNSPLQFRVSEALTLLPMLTVDAVPGLFVGCLLANWLGGGIWFDVVLGALATLMAALCTHQTRSKPVLAAIFPTLFNGLIVGPVVYFAYVRAPGAPVSLPTLALYMGAVALGELVVCYVLGLPLVQGLKRLPKDLLEG